MDRCKHGGACHHPSDPEPEMVRRAAQGEIQPLSGRIYCTEYPAPGLFCPDCILRYVHEQLCGSLPLRDGAGLFCPQDASLYVPLGLCDDGPSPGNAHPGHDSRAEIKKRDQDRPCLHFCLYRRVWSLSLSSEQHAGLPVFPGPFCVPGL